MAYQQTAVTSPTADTTILLSVAALIGGMASLSIGASFAKGLISVAGAQGAVTFRVVIAALILLTLWRPWRLQLSWRNAGVIILYGASLGALNLLFYMSIRSIPIGIAVAIQFMGPLTVAIVTSRRAAHLVWIVFAVVGLLMLLPLARTGPGLDTTGVAYALGAAVCWALYIVFGKMTAGAHPGQATALGMTIASMIVLPFGIAHAGTMLFEPSLLQAGVAVAILSSAVPHSLNMVALRQLPKRTYSIMLSLEPAMSALAAAVVLSERLTVVQSLAIGCIIIASIGSTATARVPAPAPAPIAPSKRRRQAQSSPRRTCETRVVPGGRNEMRHYVEESCRKYPDAVALALAQRAWTYAEIDETARRWASRLLDATDGRPRRVGVLGYRSETSYLGTLASQFAGAAFVPLNPRFPVRRTRTMIEMADLDALLVDSTSISQMRDLTAGLSRPPAVLTPATSAADASCEVMFDRKAMADAQPLAALPAISPDDIAYLLFTSGSTGAPKGVPVTHANAASFLDTNLRRYKLGPNDRLSQTFDQTFDLSIFDLFMAWASGARVCAMQPIELVAPASFINRHGVTVWFSVPSLAIMMQKTKLLRPDTMPSLRWSLFCGESLPLATAEAWQQAAPNSIVENLYGPTELTIACAAYRWDPDRSPGESAEGLVPIGPMYPGLSAQLVNDELQLVPDGQPGELCVAGPQTFPGYWQAPDLTDRQTVVLEGTDSRHERYYRTGDVMRRLPNGNYAFLGRRDHQIKLRGYRIELSEIEAALRHAGCIEAVVLPFPGAHHPEAIVAFVSGVTNTSGLADYLRECLPSYMVPDSIRSLELMPLNANGKIDRHALSQMIEDDSFALSSPASKPG